MFNNIGKKIKTVAQLVTYIGITLFIIIGIVVAAFGLENDDPLGIVWCIIIILIGGLISWLMSFILYGFGELIDKTTDIAKAVCGNNYNASLYELGDMFAVKGAVELPKQPQNSAFYGGAMDIPKRRNEE